MLIGQMVDGRYRIVEILSSNSFGQTFLSVDTRRPGYPQCVVKQLKLPSNGTNSSKIVKLLLNKKAELLEKLGKTGRIPELLAYFDDSNSFYSVEEFIAGQALTKEIVANQPWTEDRAISFLIEVLEILIIVHDCGVIHQDIKPANLIRRQTDGKLVLIDFGLFKDIKAQIINSKISKATVDQQSAYVPIEQSQGNAQFNSDIYAVGTIAIQALLGLSTEALLTGQGDFETEEVNWWEAELFSVNRGTIHPHLAETLDKMVRSRYAERYQSATKALEDVKKIKASKEAINRVSTTVIAPPASTIVKNQIRLPPLTLPVKILGIGSILLVLLIVAWIANLPQIMISKNFYNQGEAEQLKEDHKSAISHYNQAINVNPNDTGSYFNRGMAHYHLSNWQAAIEDFNKVILSDPQNAKAYQFRGNSRVFLGDNQGAISDYNRALQIDPSFAQAYMTRGNVRADSGDDKGAIADYNRAIKLDPNLAGAYLNRCLSQSNLGNQQAAIQDCTQAIQINPNYALAYQNRGLARFRLKDLQGAIADFNISIRLNPKDADPYYNRGLVRYDLGDKPGAIADFNQTINLNPNHALVYYDRGLALADVGDRFQALEDFQRSAKLCLEQGRTGCYKDAQYQIERLKK